MKLVIGTPLVGIPLVNAHLVDLMWTKHKQAELKSLVERYTLHGASDIYSVHGQWLACV